MMIDTDRSWKRWRGKQKCMLSSRRVHLSVFKKSWIRSMPVV